MRAAQVLLTAFDMSERIHYLNARQTLQRLLAWHVVPVINENDTTATDEITFGDNDFLSAQVAIMIEARAAHPAHRPAGLHTATRATIRRRADRGGRRPRRAGRPTRSATARRSSARAGCAARSPRRRWRAAPACRVDDLRRHRRRDAARGRRAASAIGTAFRRRTERRPASSSGCAGRRRREGRIVVDAGAARVLRESGSACCPVGSSRSRASFVGRRSGRGRRRGTASSARGSPSTPQRSSSADRDQGRTKRPRCARSMPAASRGGRSPGLLRARRRARRIAATL